MKKYLLSLFAMLFCAVASYANFDASKQYVIKNFVTSQTIQDNGDTNEAGAYYADVCDANTATQNWILMPVEGKSNTYYVKSAKTGLFLQSCNQSVYNTPITLDYTPVEYAIVLDETGDATNGAYGLASTDQDNVEFNGSTYGLNHYNNEGKNYLTSYQAKMGTNKRSFWYITEATNMVYPAVNLQMTSPQANTVVTSVPDQVIFMFDNEIGVVGSAAILNGEGNDVEPVMIDESNISIVDGNQVVLTLSDEIKKNLVPGNVSVMVYVNNIEDFFETNFTLGSEFGPVSNTLGANGGQVVFNENVDFVDYASEATCNVSTVKTKAIATQATLTLDDDIFTAINVAFQDELSDGDYTLDIPAATIMSTAGEQYVGGSVAFTVEGGVAKFFGVSPTEGEKVDMNTEYIVTFTKPVKYTSYLSDITVGQNPFGNGDGATFWMNDDKTEIHAKLDASTLAMYGITTTEELVAKMGTTVALHVYKVKDEATGEALEYNDPDGEDQLTFTYTMGEATLNVEPADGETVEKIDVVYFSCAEGLAVADASQNILVNKDKQTVATVAASDLTEDADSHAYLMTLAEPFTEAGTYEIYIPAGTFTLGGSKTNETTIVTYTIAGETTTGIHVTPAAGEVTSLQDFAFTYGNNEAIMPSYITDVITIQNEAGEQVASFTGDDLRDDGTMDADWNPLCFTASLPTAITAAGTYTMTIPAKFFTVTSSYNWSEETTFTWTIKGETEETTTGIHVTPAAGEVTSLKDFTLTYGDGTEMISPSYSYNMTITDAEGGVVASISSDDIEVAEYSGEGWDAVPSKLTFSIDEIPFAGTYTLNIPAGMFYVGPYFDNCEATSFTWTIKGGSSSTIDVTADPADGSNVESLRKITLTFNGAEMVDYSYAMVSQVTVINDATGESATSMVQLGYGNDMNQITVEMVEITEAGNYTVTIPAGTILLGFDMTPTTEDIVLHYTVGSDTPVGPTINFTADPADGSTVASLGKITLTFTSAVSADYNSAMSTSATVTNDATGESATSMTYLSWGEGWNQIVLEMVPVETEGKYTVTIPAGAILLDNAATASDIVLHYTVGVADGIDSIDATANDPKFNVAGQRVKASAKGVIIRNGKKYLNK